MPIYIPALLPMIFCETICSPCLEKNNIVFHPDCSEKSLLQCLHSIEINLFSKNRITEHILFRQGILRKVISTLHLPAELNNITAWSFETSLPALKNCKLKLESEMMEKYDELNNAEFYVEDDDFNLTNFLAVLWQSRGVIIAGTALVTLLGTSSALFLGKYQSEGFLQFGGAIPEKKIDKDAKEVKEPPPGIALADYKRYSSALNTSERFYEFVRQKNIENDPAVIALTQTFSSRGGITKVIEPIFPFTKLDAKELMASTKDAENNVIAVSINYAANTPESAQQGVNLLGRYTVDTIVYMIYTDILRFKNSEISVAITKLDNKIIENKEKIDSYERKGNKLKQIVTRYPDAASQASRQLVSITEDTARYLSPLSQLMTSEVEITEANEAIYKAKREQKQYKILEEYYGRAKALAESTKSGEAILRGLEPIKKTVFSNKDMEDETIKEVYNKISVDNSSAISLYLEKTRFIAGPSLPKNRTTRTSIALLGSLLAGLGISIFFVLGRRWWQNNRQQLQG